MDWGADANLTKRDRRVPLLSVDPELARLISSSQRAAANADILAPTGTLAPGSWEPPAKAPAGLELGLLILDGAVIREVSAESSKAVELLGAGDLIRPWQHDSASFSEPCWRVIERTHVVVLDDDAAAAIGRWPAIMTALVERALRRSRWLASQAAVSSMVGVEKRLQMTLWHVAEKWGRRQDGAVLIEVAITHQLLAEMIGASRPYVTQALSQLSASGTVTRDGNGLYVLHGDPPVAGRKGRSG